MFNILLAVLKETFMALIAKIAFKTILERFFTRLVVYGLKKLRDLNTNEVVDDTLSDIILSLSGKRLKVIEDIVADPDKLN
ncbi:hypothetical protein JYB87_11955 [Shewanella avicenniae]|uniref:Uncharacterized protein n=1 Tax=Shewanella avicenniae TaxID=2814294 RepID=A0ABX7QMJ1_9GAMM|nr:hypothetical protein [Shewanella avicenniae]QSX32479.1 hypothetical protein JYB87_11955 [Shewanella avicenniae]